MSANPNPSEAEKRAARALEKNKQKIAATKRGTAGSSWQGRLDRWRSAPKRGWS